MWLPTLVPEGPELLSATLLDASSDIESVLIASGIDDVYVIGNTITQDSPITEMDLNPSFQYTSVAFVVKFDGYLRRLISTPLKGGTEISALVLDGGDNVYVSGNTLWPRLPETPGVSNMDSRKDYRRGFVSSSGTDLGVPTDPSKISDPGIVNSPHDGNKAGKGSSLSVMGIAEKAGKSSTVETTPASVEKIRATYKGDDDKKDSSGDNETLEHGPGKESSITGPGWFMGTAKPVSHSDAEAYFKRKARDEVATGKYSVQTRAPGVIPLSATTPSTEITELARGLRYDPKLIFDYVHNHIDYVPYYGSLKGATLTYLNGSGNDFDQASLMIALLRASGYVARYVHGTMIIPGSQLANWLGVDQRWETIGSILPSGGIPITNLQSDGTAMVTRVWVMANIGGTDYLFDPAFKNYTDTSKIDIGQALGYNQSGFMTAATAGATIGTDFVRNLNEGNIRNNLSLYASNLINVIKNQHLPPIRRIL